MKKKYEIPNLEVVIYNVNNSISVCDYERGDTSEDGPNCLLYPMNDPEHGYANCPIIDVNAS